MFLVGFLFYATPLAGLVTGGLDNLAAAEVQQVLARNLPRTGTYFVPSGGTPEQTVMYGQGPIATIHYTLGGYPVMDMAAIAKGLVLDFVVALLIGAALLGIYGQVPDVGARARAVALIALAASAYINLGSPIWYHHGWAFFAYSFVADALALSAAGLIIARWFLPRARPAPTDAPTEV